MKIQEKIDFALSTIHKIVPPEQVSINRCSGRTLLAYLQFRDEEQKEKIPPWNALLDFVNEEFAKSEVGEFAVRFLAMNDSLRKDIAYRVSIQFPCIPVFGDKDTIVKCGELLDNGTWRAGIKARKRSISTCYQIGQEVVPQGVDRKKTKYKWYFITSYRSPSYMGAFRLLRSDFSMSTSGVIRAVSADD